MLNASLRPTQASNLEQLSIPNPCAFLGREALRVLDITGQVAQGIDAVVDSAARAVTTAVPAGARVVTSVLPIPETVDRAVVSSIDFITQSGVWLSKITATASMQALLLGAPAWAQAARSGVAVWGSVSELKYGDSSAQLFARCLAESSSGGSSREVPTKPSAELISEVADKTAAKLIDRVKSFYKRRLGDSAGEVVGAWERVADPAIREASLQKTKSGVSQRLAAIFSQKLSPHETRVRLNKIAATLNSDFGTYRHAFVGVLGAALGAAWHTGVLLSHATVAWGYISGGVGLAIKSASKAVRKGLDTALVWGKDQVKSSVAEIKDEIQDSIKQQLKSGLVLKDLVGEAKPATVVTPVAAPVAAPVVAAHQPASTTTPRFVCEEFLVGASLPTKV